jgi:hypothetical protein
MCPVCLIGRNLVTGGVAFALVLGAEVLLADLSSPPPQTSGAPGQASCAEVGCHDDFPANTGPGWLTVANEESTAPDSELIEVTFHGAGGSRWGFEGIALSHGGDTSFALILLDPLRTQLISSADSGCYIAHTAAGSVPASGDSISTWQFKVAFPPSQGFDFPCRRLFVSAVSADGDSTPAGDYVYNRSIEFGGSCACPIGHHLAGDANGSGTISSADIIVLVNYVFKGGSQPVPCSAIADVNCTGADDAVDIIKLVNFVFKGGAPPCDVCDFSPLLWEC